MTAAPAPLVMTCGDPAGIGPECAYGAWQALRGAVPFVWIGDPDHLPKAANWVAVDSLGDPGTLPPDALPVLPHAFPEASVPGQLNPANAQAVIDVINRAVDLCQSGQASGMVTAPIHKKVLADGAGFAFPGHTEYLAHLAGVDRVVMMLASDDLRVVPVTIHIALAEVPQALTPELLEQTIRITRAALHRDFNIAAPRIAVAGLNPHAGEGGKMGREEIEVITPVIDRLRGEGFDIAGPMSADTMFHGPARARYDTAVCMYHDQALIPIKTLAFDDGVNVTLGLPFVRTSPDHGTALDIAGSGQASPSSTIAALRMAHSLSTGA